MSAIKTRKSDHVAEDLMRRIVSGEYEVGSVLPREQELAESYGMTRGVIREAIKLLEVHRLVEPVRRRGTEVLDPRASLSPEVLRAMLRRPDGSIDGEVLADLLELRSDIDLQMTNLAARRRRPEHIRRMREQLSVIRESADHIDDFNDSLKDLTLLIAQASGNRIFSMLVHWHERVRGDIGTAMIATRRPTEAMLQGLSFLVESIAAGDEDTVRSIVRAFHEWATPQILEIATGRPEDPRRRVTEIPS